MAEGRGCVSKKPKPQQSLHPLPPLLTIEEIQARLAVIFPEEFPDRTILVGIMAARVVFVCLYGGAIEGQDRYMRPSHVYLFTEEQAGLTTDEQRFAWIAEANKQGFRPQGRRWYADTSKEPIRDDLMRNQLLRLGIMQKRPGYSTTASTPINYLSADFAALFAPALTAETLAATIHAWVTRHLDQATKQRMILKAQGINAKTGDLLIDLPDGTRIRISAGPSSIIAKDLIEQFATRHLESPALLWLSASDKKSLPQFAELSASVGLKFDLNAELPDVIFADMKQPIRFLFCEIVATDGPVTEARKQALLAIVNESQIPQNAVEFLTAFEDREAAPFRKNFSQLAVDSLVWFRTEPDLLVVLSTANRRMLEQI
jgi:hypothetical protein